MPRQQNFCRHPPHYFSLVRDPAFHSLTAHSISRPAKASDQTNNNFRWKALLRSLSLSSTRSSSKPLLWGVRPKPLRNGRQKRAYSPAPPPPPPPHTFVQQDYPWRLIPDSCGPEPIDPKALESLPKNRNRRRRIEKKRTTSAQSRPSQPPQAPSSKLPPRALQEETAAALEDAQTRAGTAAKMPSYKLLCLENPLLDIQAHG